jgi:DNA modification methylase
MQLEWARHVHAYTSKPVIILCPLAVAGQTIQEGAKLGILVTHAGKGDIQIANYEQLDNIDPQAYGGIVLDESSIIKNFMGATRNALIQAFKNTPFKLCCTATPSPNDPMELGSHSEFLNVMSQQEMLAMYFIHDGGEIGKWALKRHGHKHFWGWVSQWAIMLCKPEDIGYSMPGYDLPRLNLIEKKIITPKRNNGSMYNDMAVSATNFNAELRLTKLERLSMAADIINSSTESFIIWIKQNEEGEEMRRLIPGSVEVKGSDSVEYKEKMLLGFANSEYRVLITKSKIAQFGLNYQNCHNQIFASLDFSFESLYQSIRRSYRFGQLHPVNIYLITTDTMSNVITSIHKKQSQFLAMQQEMNKEMNPDATHERLERESRRVENKHFDIQLGDCVQLIKQVPDESVGFSIFSPPFAELYTYSDELEDMGNSRDYNEFLTAFGFLIKDLFRVLWSGRNIAVHCMDLPIQKSKEGYIGLRDFSNMIRQAFEQEGFIYHSRVTIWKDPVTEMQRTKALGLLHKQIKKDSAMSRVGLPDYLLVFRKLGEHLHPVTNTEMPVELWQKYASPVWMDIDYTNTLNGRAGRGDNDGKHICPLQLPTIERAIHLWTNPGDTVLTPFMGIGSEVFQAVKMKRRGIGFELKQTYFAEAVKNCRSAVMQLGQKDIFDEINIL